MGNPQNMNFSLVFQYKPSIFWGTSILGSPHRCLSSHPYLRGIPLLSVAPVTPSYQGAFAMKSWNSSLGIEKFPWWLRFGTCVWCHLFCQIGMTLDPSRCWWMQLITSSHCRCSMSPNMKMQSSRTPQFWEMSRMTKMHIKRRLTQPLRIFARSLWEASWTPCGSCLKNCQSKTWICRWWGGLFWSACSIPCTPTCARRIGFSTWFILFILYGHIWAMIGNLARQVTNKNLVVLLLCKGLEWITQSMSAVPCFPTLPMYIGMALSDVVRRKSLSIFALNLQRPTQMHTLCRHAESVGRLPKGKTTVLWFLWCQTLRRI